MKLNTKTRYSLRILCQLAEAETDSPVKSWEIAKMQQIPEPYLVQIMLALRLAGLVNTARGCNGGFVLARPAEQITVLDIIEKFEGKIEFADCSRNDGFCPLYNKCPTTKIWSELSDILKQSAKNISIADIVRKNQYNNSMEYMI